MGARLINIPLASQSYQSRSKFAGAPRLVNLQPERNPPEMRSPFTLLPPPGLKPWLTLGTGIVRGMVFMDPDLYVVVGSDLYAINSAKVATKVAQGITGAGPVHMDRSGTHVIIATTLTAYAANRSEIVTLSEGDFNGAAYQDGFGVFTQRGTQNIFVTNLDNMTTIDPLDFTTKDAQPDNVQGLISDHRQLIVFGKETSEFFSNIGDPEFPFARDGAGFMERGLLAPHSIAKSHDAVYFLGDDKRIYRVAGYRPQKISHAGIDQIISNAYSPADAVGWTFVHEGHDHYALAGSDFTVVYDITEERWHERVSPGETRWRAQGSVRAFDASLVADFESNAIYELDSKTYTEAGDAIRNEVTFPVFGDGSHRLFFEQLFLDFEVGEGLASGQGSDPHAVLDWSDNGQDTWSNSRDLSMGKKGERLHRVIVNQLGSAYHRTFRVACPDPTKAVLVAARVKVSAGL